MIALLLSMLAFGEIRVHRTEIEFEIAARRNAYVEGRPALRGFRAGFGPSAANAWPIELPAGDGDLARASEIVSRDLAREGLLPTLVRVIDVLGAQRFEGEENLTLLRDAGLPIDWLTYFTAPDSSSVVRHVARQLIEGHSAETVVAGLAKIGFQYRPTIPGFAVATESGEHEPECIRLQIGNDHYFSVEGDGGTVDVPRELITKIENVAFVASIQERHLEGFEKIARTWTFARGSTLTLLPQSLPVSQWAQDNAKNGIVESGGTRGTATIVPRYASRGEIGAELVPGDTFALEGFAALGRRVAQSPLLFQGGNMIPVLDPQTNKRQMILGEAELFRNMTLGLTRAQVLEAFRVEFGVERCIVLPATSFHVDYEVTLRALPSGLVAFMNDTSAAARLIVRCSMPALERAGVLTAEEVGKVRSDMDKGRWDAVFPQLATMMAARWVAYGAYPESLSKHFATSPTDLGVDNLQRFLLALDVLTAERSDAASLEKEGIDAHAVSYLLSMRRREVERQVVAKALAREGIRIVGIPSTSEGGRSLNMLNGVHMKGVYYLPVCSGLFAEFDVAAQQAFEAALGPDVRVVPIRTTESQRRQGALHCALSVIPRL